MITELPQDWGKQRLGGHKQNLVPTRTQGKGAGTWHEAEPDLPVLGTLLKRVSCGLLWGRGSGSGRHGGCGVLAKVLLEEVAVSPSIETDNSRTGLPPARLLGGNTVPPTSKKLD